MMGFIKNKIGYGLGCGLLGLIIGFTVGGYNCSKMRYITHGMPANIREDLDKDPPNGDLDGDGCYPDYIIWTNGDPFGFRPLQKALILYNECPLEDIGLVLPGRSHKLSKAENDAIEDELNKKNYFFFE